MQTPRDNPNRCWNWFLPAHLSRTGGEIAEILEVVADVRRQYRVPDDRVFALGFSAGGFMTVNLACVAPDLLTAIGVASGGPYRCGVGMVGGLQCMRGSQVDGTESAKACREALGGHRPPRASLWHGELDSVVAPRDLDALILMFTRLTTATAAPTEQREGATWSRWHDAQGRDVIEAWLVAGMGHAWSGGSARGTHTFPSGPDATERMLDFLLR
jgi:poly(hydroxyalkanoate) depolymerase family esterase